MHSYSLRILLFITWLHACAILHGQKQSEIDNLISSLATMPADTIKMYHLIDVGGRYLRTSDYPSADKYYLQALAIADKHHHQHGKAIAYGNMGLVAFYQGDYSEALQLLNTSLQINQKLHQRKAIADNYTNIGMVKADQGYFDEAIANYTIALTYRDSSDLRGKSAGYNNLGIIYFQQGEYAHALEYYLKSLAIDEQLGDKLDLALSNNNIGMVYEHQQDIGQAIKYYKLANALCTDVGHKECIAGTNSNIAELLKQQGKTKEALKYYFSSLKIFEEIGNEREIGATAENIGALYHQLGEHESALEFYKKAFQHAKSLDDRQGTAMVLSDLGMLYRDLNQYTEARTYLHESIDLFEKTGSRAHLQETYLRLSRLDSMMGNFSEALIHFKRYTELQDSIGNETNMRLLTEVQGKYESEKKDKEIVKLESEKQVNALALKIKSENLTRIQLEQHQLFSQNQMQTQQIALLDKDKKLQDLELEKNEARMEAHEIESRHKEDQLTLLSRENEIKNLRLRKQQQKYWYSIAGFLLLSLTGILYYQQNKTRQKLNLQMLRNKIALDLHDEVGSTLSSIAIFSEVAQQQSKEVIPMLNTIRDNSRKMLEAMGDIVWTINPENDQFEKIILRMRNFAFEFLGAKKIEFEFIANEDLSQLKLPMDVRKNLYLIFKEAANNLVKYSAADRAHFSVTEEKGTLTMVISDNGRGFNPAIKVEGNGIESMKQRAKDIGALLNIRSLPGAGTSIELTLAL